MDKILCFGELLMRMSPALHGDWIREASMAVYVGGAELNVASALARWELPVKYCTALPDNYLSGEIISELDRRNIDSSAVQYSGNRIGIYFLPQGADLKHAGVIYDRAHSAFAALRPGMIDWGTILKDVSWFHFSAITPALNENMGAVCQEALEAASRKKIRISVDLNYRAQLWQYGSRPTEIMPALAAYCDTIMGNIWSAHALLDIPVEASVHTKGKKSDYLEQARITAMVIRKKFPLCTTVAHTFRFDHAGGIRYYASLEQEGGQYVSDEFAAAQIVDKVGSGDCFMAGMIYGLVHGHPPQETIDFAASAAFGKFQEKGDATKQDISTIRSRIKKHG